MNKKKILLARSVSDIGILRIISPRLHT